MTRSVTTTDVQDIQGVLVALRTVVDDAARSGDRTGLFAAVYRQVTAAIARGVADGLFDDAERLNRFDAVFAGRYLTALEARRDGRDPGRSWRLAFRAAEDPDLVLVQHVVLGINAHINLDLAVAAAQMSPGDGITGSGGCGCSTATPTASAGGPVRRTGRHLAGDPSAGRCPGPLTPSRLLGAKSMLLAPSAVTGG